MVLNGGGPILYCRTKLLGINIPILHASQYHVSVTKAPAQTHSASAWGSPDRQSGMGFVSGNRGVTGMHKLIA